MEVIYCLFCMAIFLLIIYWNHEEHTDIILGKDAQYESDEEKEDMSHEEYLEEMRLQKIRQLEIDRFDRQLSILNPDSFSKGWKMDRTIISDGVFGKQLNQTLKQRTNDSLNGSDMIQNLNTSSSNLINKSDMKYDSVYTGYSRSKRS